MTDVVRPTGVYPHPDCTHSAIGRSGHCEWCGRHVLQPYWVAWCRALGRIEEALTIKAWPRDEAGGEPFTLWIAARWREWYAENPNVQEGRLRDADRDAFGSWLCDLRGRADQLAALRTLTIERRTETACIQGNTRTWETIVLTFADGTTLRAHWQSHRQAWTIDAGDGWTHCIPLEREHGLLTSIHHGPATYGHVTHLLTDAAVAAAGSPS